MQLNEENKMYGLRPNFFNIIFHCLSRNSMHLVKKKKNLSDPAVTGKMSSWSVYALCLKKEIRPLFGLVLIHIEMISNVWQNFIIS